MAAQPLLDGSLHGILDSGAAARVTVAALARVLAAWRVGTQTGAKLAGLSGRTWIRRKGKDWDGSLTQDELMRASALIGLYKGLHIYFGDDLADKWPRMANRGPLFGGASPVDFMVAGGLPAIIAAREYVDALRGGM
jgi:uncharacterized protein (DUF2384 family)